MSMEMDVVLQQMARQRITADGTRADGRSASWEEERWGMSITYVSSTSYPLT